MVNWGMGYEFLSLLPFSYPSFIASPVLFPHYSVKIKRFVQHLNCILHLAFDNIYINYRKKVPGHCSYSVLFKTIKKMD